MAGINLMKLHFQIKRFLQRIKFRNITDKDYAHGQEVFEIKNRGRYRYLYIQCDTFFLADVFENFRDKCIKVYGLDSAHFLSAPGIV